MMTLLCLFVAVVLAVPAQGQIFTCIADQNTLVLGAVSGETFSTLAEEDQPLVSDSCIVFRGQGDMGAEGIYLVRHGVIEVVADRNTRVPAGVGRIEGFEEFEEFQRTALVPAGHERLPPSAHAFWGGEDAC